MINKDKVKKAIIKAIWNDLCGRQGYDLGCLDKDIQTDVKDSWGEAILKILDKEEKDMWKR
jgi:hypothetical protein